MAEARQVPVTLKLMRHGESEGRGLTQLGIDEVCRQRLKMHPIDVPPLKAPRVSASWERTLSIHFRETLRILGWESGKETMDTK